MANTWSEGVPSKWLQLHVTKTACKGGSFGSSNVEFARFDWSRTHKKKTTHTRQFSARCPGNIEFLWFQVSQSGRDFMRITPQKLTNVPLRFGHFKGKDRFPTTIFQGTCLCWRGVLCKPRGGFSSSNVTWLFATLGGLGPKKWKKSCRMKLQWFLFFGKEKYVMSRYP